MFKQLFPVFTTEPTRSKRPCCFTFQIKTMSKKVIFKSGSGHPSSPSPFVSVNLNPVVRLGKRVDDKRSKF